MTKTTVSNDDFRVIGPELPAPQRRGAVTKVERNLDRVRENPGAWCVVNTYKTIQSASKARIRFAEMHPEFGWDSRSIDGVPTLSALFEP